MRRKPINNPRGVRRNPDNYGTKEELRIQALSKIIKNTFKRCGGEGCRVRISSNKEFCLACKEGGAGAH